MFIYYGGNFKKADYQSQGWIGMNKKGGYWTTVFGEPLHTSSLNWATFVSDDGNRHKQPDNRRGDEDCGALAFRKVLNGYGLSDKACDYKLAFICESIRF